MRRLSDIAGRDLATFALCTWAVVVGFFYLDVDVPLTPFVVVGLLLSIASFVRSLRSRDAVGTTMSLAALGVIAVVVALALVISLGGAWDR